MYCPRCSREFALGTGYCRTCGLSLEGVVEIVKGEAESEPEIRTGPNSRLMRAAIGSLILGSVVGLGIPLLKNLELFAAADIAKFVFLIIIMLALLLLGVGTLFPQKRYIKKKRSESHSETDENPIPAAGRLDQLPSSDRSVDEILMPNSPREPDSVTEHTTRRLG